MIMSEKPTYEELENRVQELEQAEFDRKRAMVSLRESEARMRVMVGELQHRTRNLIGVVMALVDRTSTSGQTIKQFKSDLSDRLMATPPIMRQRIPSILGVAYRG